MNPQRRIVVSVLVAIPIAAFVVIGLNNLRESVADMGDTIQQYKPWFL